MSKVYSILSNSNVNCPGNFLDITKDILNWRKIRAIFSHTASDKKTNNPSTAIEDKRARISGARKRILSCDHGHSMLFRDLRQDLPMRVPLSCNLGLDCTAIFATCKVRGPAALVQLFYGVGVVFRGHFELNGREKPLPHLSIVVEGLGGGIHMLARNLDHLTRNVFQVGTA